MSHLLYLMFRCDGDVMESLDFGGVFKGSKHTRGGVAVRRSKVQCMRAHPARARPCDALVAAAQAGTPDKDRGRGPRVGDVGSAARVVAGRRTWAAPPRRRRRRSLSRGLRVESSSEIKSTCPPRS